MAFRYPVPDETLSQRLVANHIDPKEFFIRHQTEEAVYLQNYDTGDEIRFRINPYKKGGA